MQQSLRVGQYEMVRLLRMAGRGGLAATSPSRIYPQGVAIEVRNNVGTGSPVVSDDLAIGFAGTPKAVLGTDIITVRGVISSPIYQIASTITGIYPLRTPAGALTTDPTTADHGAIQICDPTPTGAAQNLQPLKDAITKGVHEALILGSPVNDSIYGVVELDPNNPSNATTASACPGGTGVVVAFKVASGTYGASYQKLSSAPAGSTTLPSVLSSVSVVGIIEEYRFYIRKDLTVDGNNASEVAPRLSRARLFPGTEVPYGTTAADQTSNVQSDIADNVMDLQAALVFDSNGDGVITDASSVTDEWMYNAVGDDPTQAAWKTIVGSVPARATPLFYARVSSLARTDRRDTNFTAPLLTNIEDHVYTTSDPANTLQSRMFRRRLLQTVVDLRDF